MLEHLSSKARACTFTCTCLLPMQKSPLEKFWLRLLSKGIPVVFGFFCSRRSKLPSEFERRPRSDSQCLRRRVGRLRRYVDSESAGRRVGGAAVAAAVAVVRFGPAEASGVCARDEHPTGQSCLLDVPIQNNAVGARDDADLPVALCAAHDRRTGIGVGLGIGMGIGRDRRTGIRQ